MERLLEYDSSILMYDPSILYYDPSFGFPEDGLLSYWAFEDSAVSPQFFTDSWGPFDITGDYGGSTLAGFHDRCYYLRAEFGSIPPFTLRTTNPTYFNFDTSTAFSISFWIKRFSADYLAPNFEPIIFYKSLYTLDPITGRALGTAGFGAWFDSVNYPVVSLFNQQGSNSVLIETAVGATSWNHLVFTWNGTYGGTGLYLNGSNTNIYRENINVGSFMQTGIKSLANLVFGLPGLNDPSVYNHSAHSYIDEVALYDRALGIEDVQRIYNNGTGRFL